MVHGVVGEAARLRPESFDHRRRQVTLDRAGFLVGLEVLAVGEDGDPLAGSGGFFLSNQSQPVSASRTGRKPAGDAATVSMTLLALGAP
jgi:hypothetical protein